MAILDTLFKILINVFTYFGNIAAKVGCGAYIDEPTVPKELIDKMDK
ncbi:MULTISPECIES: cyclic lactone autoinducer peptide AgrD [Staphylococcus]|uniref:Cyclic lactone autoinducer peptide n=1 Tax=Staphylococcus argensis TaxID=1607738 RepID=A0A2K4FCU9_9STAP|nr:MULTISPECIES: cyclic lactone autoinducer peptide [Staphylococcus]MCY1590944.1 cyclic lactone autoinducer peptide [Staphylococcus pettenkoferi]MCY1599435.1 cyclic lactone autoinducer peptide [Staphylococcus pettenkoferi]MCY1602363.1 cyclic lactone autoinducer peptide [Staphylococcus pettenkoferi]MCY1608739.1 cyclic lactone autoinducer peptide [Staphylococcus pettenkoferi]MCY1612176.1 cyclic lactone autoinducer peptide [Staphylococcus pettenkoferi]